MIENPSWPKHLLKAWSFITGLLQIMSHVKFDKDTNPWTKQRRRDSGTLQPLQLKLLVTTTSPAVMFLRILHY